MRKINPQAEAIGPGNHADAEFQFFERQLQRYSGGGDCAYERSLNLLYRRLFEQRRSQLDALRRVGGL